jgi:short subunit dehydrogenase-like uncharacterized protein
MRACRSPWQSRAERSIGYAPLARLGARTGSAAPERHTGRARLWGEVRNAAGERRTAGNCQWLRLTADGMFRTAKWLLERRPEGGYTTPSMLMGARCVEQSPQSTCIRLD